MIIEARLQWALLLVFTVTLFSGLFLIFQPFTLFKTPSLCGPCLCDKTTAIEKAEKKQPVSIVSSASQRLRASSHGRPYINPCVSPRSLVDPASAPRPRKSRPIVPLSALPFPMQQLAPLRGRHLLLMGDSITRYQYLSLVYFITTGEWTFKSIKTESGTIGDFAWEKSYALAGNWTNFYAENNALLNTPTTAERCDCSRTYYTTGKKKVYDNYENRFFYHKQWDIRVSYIQWFDKPMHGHCNFNASNASSSASTSGSWLEGQGEAGGADVDTPPPLVPFLSPSCSPNCAGPADFSLDAVTFIKEIIPGLAVDYFVFNQGWHHRWGKAAGDAAFLSDLFTASANSAVFAIWKSTTRNAKRPGSVDYFDSQALAEKTNVSVFDAFSITSEMLRDYGGPATLYYDALHVKPQLNGMLNIRLLSYLTQLLASSADA